MGQSACATINAANEVALSAFISEKISFLRIMEVVETVLTKAHSAGALGEISSYEDVSAVEENARRLAAEVISQEKGS
jgi:1-deoxy-D-xylulose-5-phosphate reductoisomerase